MMGYIDGLNLDEVEEWDGDGGNFDPPAEGDYLFRVNKCESEKSKAGFPMLVTKLEVVSAADGTDTDEAGKEMTDWRSLKNVEGCRKRVKAFITACGIELDDKGGFDTEDFGGAEFVATVRHETSKDGKYDNNPRISRERAAPAE